MTRNIRSHEIVRRYISLSTVKVFTQSNSNEYEVSIYFHIYSSIILIQYSNETRTYRLWDLDADLDFDLDLDLDLDGLLPLSGDIL